MATVQEQVFRLEDDIRAFVHNVGVEFNKAYNAQTELRMEMRAFQEEMRQFREASKAETQAFKEEMRQFREASREEMMAFKEEMRQFRDVSKAEMVEFNDRVAQDIEAGRRENREMNRRWGEISNKLGTLVEDLVYPSLTRIVRQALDLEVIDLTVRHRRRLADGRNREFDAIATTDDVVVLNSTKATLRSADVDRFIGEIDELREFFPEFRERPVVGVLASIAVEPSVLAYAEKTGFLVIATGDEVMEIKNRPGFAPKRW